MSTEVECTECGKWTRGPTEREAVIRDKYHYLNEHNPTEEQERLLRDRIDELRNGGPLEKEPHPAFVGD